LPRKPAQPDFSDGAGAISRFAALTMEVVRSDLAFPNGTNRAARSAEAVFAGLFALAAVLSSSTKGRETGSALYRRVTHMFLSASARWRPRALPLLHEFSHAMRIRIRAHADPYSLDNRGSLRSEMRAGANAGRPSSEAGRAACARPSTILSPGDAGAITA